MTNPIRFASLLSQWNFAKQVCEALPEAPAAEAAACFLESSEPRGENVSELRYNRPALWRQDVLDSGFKRLGRVEPLPASKDNSLGVGLAIFSQTGCTSGNSGEPKADSGVSPDAKTPPPTLDGFAVHSTAPCGAEGNITDLDNGIGVCANYSTNTHELFSWNPDSGATPQPIIALPFSPDQAVQASNGEVFMTAYNSAGLEIVDTVAGTSSSIPLPATIATSRPTSSGRQESSFRPSFPKGLVEIGGNLFIATSNYDLANRDFHPGIVLSYDRGTESFRPLPLETSGYNPTSVANIDGNLLVVSSGAIDINGHVSTDSWLDLFNPSTGEKIRSLNLGACGAGLSGDLALSRDGRILVLPTADNSGRLVVVDLVDWQEVRKINLKEQGLSGEKIFFPSVQIDEAGTFAIVGNYNDGKLYGVDLADGRLSPISLTIDHNTQTDNVGLSDGLQIGGKFFIGMGPQILQIRTH